MPKKREDQQPAAAKESFIKSESTPESMRQPARPTIMPQQQPQMIAPGSRAARRTVVPMQDGAGVLATNPVRDPQLENSVQEGNRLAAKDIVAAMRGETGGGEPRKRIGKEDIIKAARILQEYKKGKNTVDNRIIRAQEWWKLQNWKMIHQRKGINGSTIKKSSTAWLWNCVVGKHADAMDSFPEPVILPRMEEDKAQAKILSQIIPVILELSHFEDVYDEEQYQKFQEGTGGYFCGWDKTKMGGMGDISIKKFNLLQLFWEPGVEDIQDSANLFYTRLMDNEQLSRMYPQLEGKLGHALLVAKEYRTDDKVDTSKKSVLVDWYYHRWEDGKKILHYVQFVGEDVLYSTENDDDPEMADGLYHDGEYPFILDPLYKVAGSPAGYGYFDIAQDAQADIDAINQAMVQNAIVTSTPRFFLQGDGAINEDEFADWSKPFVHVNGGLAETSIRQIETVGIQNNALNMLDRKIDELKFVTGNSDVNNGGTPAGVTAASAIAALQEISGRTSKDTNRGSYRAYMKLISMVIERIRQFYSIPRQFRIMGPNSQEEFISFTNAKMQDQALSGGVGLQPGFRKPVFDVEVRAQRETAYSRLSQNELAVQFLGLGIFNPQMADQALMMLDMMEFKGKDELVGKIRQNGTLLESLFKVSQIAMALAEKYQDTEPGVAEMLANIMNMMAADAGLKPPAEQEVPGAETGGGRFSDEDARMEKAREQTHNSTRIE